MKYKIAFWYSLKGSRIEEVEMPKLKPNQALIKKGIESFCLIGTE